MTARIAATVAVAAVTGFCALLGWHVWREWYGRPIWPMWAPETEAEHDRWEGV